MVSRNCRPIALRCEYQDNPVGIDVLTPRLSWVIDDHRLNARQTAYQIVSDNGWDSGRVKSDQSIQVAYIGPALKSRQRVAWRVRTWDAHGRPSAWSDSAWFEMGLLERKEWQAEWIGSPLEGGPRSSVPCPYLRKAFAVTQPVKSARLYVTALGLYEFHLNGAKVGQDEFRPGWTDYRTRVQYDVYDVTAMIRSGRNCAGAILGDGWYCGHIAADGRQMYGDRPRLLAQLMLDFKDGSTQRVVTDATWKTTAGPILEADLLMGEAYDARHELPGWDKPNYNDRTWWPVEQFPDPGIQIVARLGQPVRVMREIKPASTPVLAKGLGWGWTGWVADLGQNMVGRARIKVRAKAGTTFRVRYAEMLDKDGKLYLDNLRSARATDYFTTAKDGVTVWEPRFTFHGFRYVEVTYHARLASVGWSDASLHPDLVTGVVLHTDLTETGVFECSNPLINQLQHNIQWGQRGNYLEVPTDCPQRDERLGWTGDAQVFIKTGAFNFDIAGFFTKWQQDFADAQHPDGSVPVVIPNHPGGRFESPAWSDAIIICPWTIYRCYGDKSLLAHHYDAMKRYVEYLKTGTIGLVRCHPDYPAWDGFGDWLALDGSGRTEGGTPKDLIGTAFFAYSARLLGRIAGVLGNDHDAIAYAALFQRIKKAFQKRFINQDGFVGAGTQTGYVLALHFDLMPESLRQRALTELVRDITRRGNKLSTGFVGTSYLPYVLSDNGHAEMAFKLLNQKDWPSWLYAVTQGATTVWERWDGWTQEKGFQDAGMNSFNHYAYGAIGEWLYSRVAGIDLDPVAPAYRKIVFRPLPGGGLSYARAGLRTPYGWVRSAWHLAKDRFVLDVQLPANTSGMVYLPGGRSSRKIGSGTHHFEQPWRSQEKKSAAEAGNERIVV